MYRDVQPDSTPEIEVFYMLFERCHFGGNLVPTYSSNTVV